MNQKNLNAIETSLLNIILRGRLSADEIHVMGLSMANAGVLVPSSLTDEEAALLGSLWPDTTVPVLGSAVKAQLEWLAKGDRSQGDKP